MEASDQLFVDADRAVLRQAIVNLVDNGTKYAPAGSTIRVRVEQAPAQTILEVIDTGPGIAEEHREQVFERFYRVDASRSRELGGTGLGLAIARWAVQAHGGHIELETEPGQGSVFRIVLPATTKPERSTS